MVDHSDVFKADDGEDAPVDEPMAEVIAAIEAACQFLDGLPDPLRQLWTRLDPAELERLLRDCGPRVETMLRDFSAPSPRRPNRATAHHLRRAVGSLSPSRLERAVHFVCTPVISEVRHQGVDDALVRWGPALCQLALVAGALNRKRSPALAPYCVSSLLELDLLPEAWQAHRDDLEAVCDEAIGALAGADEDEDEDFEDVDVEEMERATIAEELAGLKPAELAPWAAAQVEACRGALAEAREAGAAVVAAVDAGATPDFDSARIVMMSIAVISRAARRVHAALQHSGGTPVAGDDIASLERAVSAIADAVDPGAAVLRRLAAVEGPPGADALMAGLVQAARDPDRREFALALVGLIDAVAVGAGPLRVAELDAAARQVAPGELTAAVVLAATGHLHLPTATSPTSSAPDGAAATAGDASKPQAAPPTPEVVAEGPEPPAAPPTPEVVAEAPAAPPTTAVEAGRSGTGIGSEPAAADHHAGPPEAASHAPTGEVGRPAPAPTATRAQPASGPYAPGRPVVSPVPAPAPSLSDEAAVEAQAEERIWACEQLVLSALEQRRFALAWWASVASGAPARLLRLVALATSVHTSTGPTTDALRDETLGLSRASYGSFPGIQVLAALAAVRASLVAPTGATSSVAAELARMLELPGLGRLAEAAVTAANRGVALAGDTLSGLGDADRLDTRIRAHAAEAAGLLGKERRFNFQRASEIWRMWTAADGLLGAVLAPVAADDRSRVGEVATVAAALRERGAAERALRDADGRLRGSGSKRIEGSARNNLLEAAADAAGRALAWCNDVAQLSRSARDAGWLDVPTAELRSAATEVEVVVRNELRGAATDPVSAAAAGAAGEVLDDIYRLLAGQPPEAGLEAPAMILGLDLLLGDSRVDAELAPVGRLEPEQLAPGLTRDLRDAFAARSRRGDHLASGLIVEALAATDPDDARALDARRTEMVAAARAATEAAVAVARTQLDQARRQLFVSEDRYAELAARLEGAARPGREDFDALEEELAAVEVEVGEDRRLAVEQFLSQLDRAAADAPALAAVRDRIATLAVTDLATAAEWRSLAAEGRSLAEAAEVDFDLGEIWPGAVEAVGPSITDELVEAAAARRDHGSLQFSALAPEAAERGAAALRRWRRLGRGAARRNDWLEELRPVLRLLGIDADGLDAAAARALPSSPQRQWIELTGVDRRGSRALVPAFGSKAGPRLRVLVAAAAPSEAALLEWATPEHTDRPVLVLHLGTLPAEFRDRFSQSCRQRRARPTVAVVDDAVLAWAAARGEFRFETLMRAVLPWCATNPYLPPSGDCPPELFYGRSDARRSLIDTAGSCLLYGGRQLGKSALLRSTVRDFDAVPGNVACYIDLKPSSIASTRRADVVWDLLWKRLGEHGVVPAGKAVGKDPATKVEAAVKAYLAADAGRRILVALDECDEFFDVDAATSFATTSRLKDLMDTTGRRFKVVWAGLHQVARFANIPNQPLVHLGRPMPIGPLDPGSAHRLIADPMRALGITFASPDLVNRVLAYCNYQPVLLHLFGSALVEQMLFPPKAPPPVVVEATDVEAVASSPGLQHEVWERFEWTLQLDPRYRVIAYTVAFEAHNRGIEVALPASELRAACERWWPTGFASLDPAEFRALLEEMASLGVLSASTGRTGWRLRSPNVLRMLGTVAQVEDRLLEEESRLPTWLVATEARRVLADGRRSPVTEGQLADLVGEGRNQVRVVIGSEATCVGALADAVRSVADATGRFRVRLPGNYDTFRRNLGEGSVGEHLVVVSDLRGVSDESFAKTLSAAVTRVPRGGTRSVLVVADASNFEAVAGLVDPAGEAVAGVEVLPLRRLDSRGMRAWALEVESAFQDDEARRRLADITGGWPVLIDQAGELARKGLGTGEILAEMATRLAADVGMAGLIAAVGLGREGPLVALVKSLAASPGAGLAPEDLAVFVEDCDRPAAVVAMLRGLGVLETALGTEGELRLEPVLARCWAAAPNGDG